MKGSYKLEINQAAAQDIDEIYTDGLLNWGELQADKYYDGLVEHLLRLTENPYLYQAVPDIREGYRRSVYRRHAVYYRVGKAEVEIMAVVKHQNMDNRSLHGQ